MKESIWVWAVMALLGLTSETCESCGGGEVPTETPPESPTSEFGPTETPTGTITSWPSAAQIYRASSPDVGAGGGVSVVGGCASGDGEEHAASPNTAPCLFLQEGTWTHHRQGWEVAPTSLPYIISVRGASSCGTSSELISWAQIPHDQHLTDDGVYDDIWTPQTGELLVPEAFESCAFDDVVESAAKGLI